LVSFSSLMSFGSTCMVTTREANSVVSTVPPTRVLEKLGMEESFKRVKFALLVKTGSSNVKTSWSKLSWKDSITPGDVLSLVYVETWSGLLISIRFTGFPLKATSVKVLAEIARRDSEACVCIRFQNFKVIQIIRQQLHNDYDISTCVGAYST